MSENIPKQVKVDDKPLGQFGPPAELIDKWKKEYPLGIFYTKFFDGEPNELVFVYRAISFLEYMPIQNAMAAGDPSGAQAWQELQAKCILWPDNYRVMKGAMPAGVPSTLANIISISSGFAQASDPKQL
jgi:hypothetical protein